MGLSSTVQPKESAEENIELTNMSSTDEADFVDDTLIHIHVDRSSLWMTESTPLVSPMRYEMSQPSSMLLLPNLHPKSSQPECIRVPVVLACSLPRRRRRFQPLCAICPWSQVYDLPKDVVETLVFTPVGETLSASARIRGVGH
jgi:hypothetical protein